MKEQAEFPLQVRDNVTYYGTMHSTLTGTAFSTAGIIALIAGILALIGAGVFLILKNRKRRVG